MHCIQCGKKLNSSDGQNVLCAECRAPVETETTNWTYGNSGGYFYFYPFPNPNIQYGWICPQCGKVNAPWVSICQNFLCGVEYQQYKRGNSSWD